MEGVVERRAANWKEYIPTWGFQMSKTSRPATMPSCRHTFSNVLWAHGGCLEGRAAPRKRYNLTWDFQKCYIVTLNFLLFQTSRLATTAFFCCTCMNML